jgi:hypothetical protein
VPSSAQPFVPTADFRGTALVPLAVAIGRLVELRGAAYAIHRASLGRAGQHLPERFSDIVDVVICFADPLDSDDDPTLRWHPDQRSWEGSIR